MMRVFGRVLPVAFLSIVGLAVASRAPAQEPQEKWSRLLGPDGEAVAPDLSKMRSRFTLFGSADFGRVDMNLSGPVFMCWENRLGDWPETFICPFGFMPQGPPGGTLAWRTMGYHYGVPPSEWNRAKAKVPSLANATGGGYNVFSSYTEEALVAPVPMDGSLGPIQSGITSTPEVPCRDQSPWGSGVPMLAAIDCPESWGSLAWTGANLITEEEYVAEFQENPSNFRFDFWRSPNAYSNGEVGPNPVGAFVTYGYESDWSEEKRFGYGKVMPGGTGDPARQGWPLGIVVRTDAFSVPVPTLANVMFTQTLIINRSEDVYGVPLDYDSLYFSLAATFWWHSNIQNASYYFEPWSGAVKSVTLGVDPTCNGAKNPSDISCTPITNPTLDGGFRKGKWGGAYIVLKSPIGDLRNKLFTSPISKFFQPGHPLAGDTITFNHGHMCGFRACARTTWRAVAEPDWQRRMFGLLSSITADVMGSRTFAAISGRDYWHITRSYTHPQRSDPTTSNRRGQGFNTHIPGVDPETRQGLGRAAIWDYNHDLRPDTLFLDSCNPFGCVDTWADTLRGPPGSGPYNNAYGNVGTVVGAGPFRLAAGDTAAWVMAWLVAPSQADVEKFVGNAIAHYINFYAAPGPPPPPSVRAVTVTPGDPTEISVKLFFGDEPEEWVDPFLLKRAAQLPSEGVSIQNPWLPDTVAFLARNNLKAVHVFRSCDGGDTFDADGDCIGDEATGGKFEGLGWLPYATFDKDELGQIPNVFEDKQVTGGRNFLYIFVSESRGAEPLISKPDGRAEVFPLAPPLLSGLSRGVNSATVYVPLSLQAGASRAKTELLDQAGPAPVAPAGFHDLRLDAAGDDPDGDVYRAIFGKPVVVTERIFGEPEKPDSVVSSVEVTNEITGEEETFTTRRVAGVTSSGGTTTETPGVPLVRKTTHTSLAAVLLREGTGDEPLLVTSVLTGDAATPGTFITRTDWPKLLLSVNNRPGQFKTQFYLRGLGDTVPEVARPGITWGVGAARSSGASFGDYAFAWEDNAYGPKAPFVLDFQTPENTEDAIAASLAARAVPQRTMAADTQAIRLAKAALTALGQTLRAGALTERDIVDGGSLPFKIRNVTFRSSAEAEGRAVEAIMLRRPRDNRLFGDGGDTLRVAVPLDAWLPGDTLILVEEVPTAPGATTTEKKVTWYRAVLACFETTQFTRETCNPVSGRGQRRLYLSPRPGQELHVQYFNAFTSQSRYRFSVEPALAGEAITEADIRKSLTQVKVVPNPFIVHSRTPDNTIVFTHLPPRGRLRIYTLSGQFVQEIKWESGDLTNTSLGAQTGAQGDLRYDLRTREGNVLASGLYIFHVTALDENDGVIAERLGKFVIIR